MNKFKKIAIGLGILGATMLPALMLVPQAHADIPTPDQFTAYVASTTNQTSDYLFGALFGGHLIIWLVITALLGIAVAVVVHRMRRGI